MNSLSIRFFITIFLSILLLRTFLYADYSDLATSTWNDAVVQLQALSNSLKQSGSAFGDRVKNFMSGASERTFGKQVVAQLRKKSPIFSDNVYEHDPASVRLGNELSDQERACLAKRKPKIHGALEEMLQAEVSENNVPIVSIIMSGGGYRAMLGALGFLAGAEKIGLLDVTTYISTLSGSTWAVAPWVATGMKLSDFKEYIVDQITEDINSVTHKESRLISGLLYAKLLSHQPITMVDIYGALLANRLLADFEKRRQLVKLSDLSERIKNGDYPYAIYTAIDGRMAVAHDAPWFEFTPHEIGCTDFQLYIPTWAYGRKFNVGQSVNTLPEQSLGFQLGTFGSAFGVHIEYAWNEIAHKVSNPWIKSVITEIVKNNAGKRMFWASIPNFMFGMKVPEWSARKNLKLVDAGLAFNLPYPPVSGQRSERRPDVLIFCDMSAKGKALAFEKCEEYARKRGLPFPVIDYDGISDKTISIFKDETDSSIPVVIYMPRFSDHALWEKNKSNSLFSQYKSIDGFDIEQCIKTGFCKTTNFQYSPEQSQKIIDQMEFNVVVNKEKIIDAIRFVVERE